MRVGLWQLVSVLTADNKTIIFLWAGSYFLFSEQSRSAPTKSKSPGIFFPAYSSTSNWHRAPSCRPQSHSISKLAVRSLNNPLLSPHKFLNGPKYQRCSCETAREHRSCLSAILRQQHWRRRNEENATRHPRDFVDCVKRVARDR